MADSRVLPKTKIVAEIYPEDVMAILTEQYPRIELSRVTLDVNDQVTTDHKKANSHRTVYTVRAEVE